MNIARRKFLKALMIKNEELFRGKKIGERGKYFESHQRASIYSPLADAKQKRSFPALLSGCAAKAKLSNYESGLAHEVKLFAIGSIAKQFSAAKTLVRAINESSFRTAR